MIITIPWLKEHLKTAAKENEIIDQLTNIGLEVEAIKENSGEMGKFKIAKVLKAEKHPNADKLKVCDVTIGGKEILKVVCGAPNVREGLITIYAPPGAVIPKTNFELKVAKIRGVESKGMLCSESELNLSNDSEGIIELKNNEKEIGKSYFKGSSQRAIDISITPNRADCLGIRGIARDLSSAGVGKLIQPIRKKIKQNTKHQVKTSITKEKNQGCYIFGSCYIKNITNKESPEWLKNKLIALGLKPISAVVDITNYVMFDLNRPLHAYDSDKINKEIIVRNAKEGEIFDALDKKKYKLKKDMCVISDKSGVLGLGGIIGGTTTSTELETKNILLEAAYFSPSSIRKTARELNINTDAKYRFERGIDPNSIKEGLELATELILKICGGEASKFQIVGKTNKKNKIINFQVEKFEKLIGISITAKEIDKILSSLGFKCKKSQKSLKIEVPSWRPDVSLDEDLIEELIRIKGFDNIKLIKPSKERTQDTLTFKQKLFHLSQRSLASKGYMEIVTWSFTDSKIDKQFSKGEKEIRILNPISSDLDVLRSSIFSNLIIHLNRNLGRGFKDLPIFEIGPTFLGEKPGEQQTVVGGLKSGKNSRQNWIEKERLVDVFDVKKDVIQCLDEAGYDKNKLYFDIETPSYYHPGKSGRVFLNKGKEKVVAFFGDIHPNILKKLDIKTDALIGFEIFLEHLDFSKKTLNDQKSKFTTSDFQKSERDFAFVVNRDVKAQDLINAISSVDQKLISNIKVFDVYEGENIPENQKSIAISVTIQSNEKTLNDNDLEKINNLIIQTVENKTGAKIRS